MKAPALAIYTLKRLLVLGVALAVCYALGLRDLWLLVVALLASGAVSLLLLNKDRDKASTAVFAWSKRFNQRVNSAAAREDAILDAIESTKADDASLASDPGKAPDPNREGERKN